MFKVIRQAEERLGIEGFPPEVKQEILEKAGELIFRAVLLRAVPLLSDAQKDEFAGITETQDLGKIGEFLQANVPDLDSIINEEMESFVKDSKTVTDAMKVKAGVK